MLRESSLRPDLAGLLDALKTAPALASRLMLTNDGSMPAFLRTHGFVDHLIRVALERGVIDAAARDELFRCAQSRYFPERTYEHMMRSAEGRVAPEKLLRFREFLQKECRDFKMEDALAALQRTREIANDD